MIYAIKGKNVYIYDEVTIYYAVITEVVLAIDIRTRNSHKNL